MKADIDRLMAKHNLDVIVVLSGEEPSTYRRYLMNGVEANGHVIKVRDQAPIAIVSPMETEKAAPSGLKIYTPYDFGMGEAQKQYKGDRAAVQRAYFATIFEKLGLRGRVAFYGTGDIFWATRLVKDVFSTLATIEIVTDFAVGDLFEAAYRTKDAAEIAQLKRVAQLSGEVVKATHGFLTGLHAAPDGSVTDASGTPVTIGAVKRFISYQLLERGLENANGHMIFAQGRDAGFPHSSGQDDLLRSYRFSIRKTYGACYV